MERIESRFSPRARRLISRAFTLGVDPLHIKHESHKVVKIAQREGKQKVTRGDLRNLAGEVRAVIGSQRFIPESPIPDFSVRPWNRDEFWNM